MSTAPIALFAYKRPSHTKATLEALARCDQSDRSRLIVYCDGAKKPEDQTLVDEVRAIAKSQPWCGNVEVVERERNMGLAASIIDGVTSLCEKYGRVIVIEDDLVLASNFLGYMNEALDRYEAEPKVMQISGHQFDVDLAIDEDALFMPFVTTWGWATWARAWEKFDASMSGYDKLKADPARRRRFNLDGAYDYFDLLERQRAGKVDSWGIRWNLSVFDNDGLVLYPKTSLVDNRGFDGSGTHCRDGQSGSSDFGSALLDAGEIRKFPEPVLVPKNYAPVLNHLRGNTRNAQLRRMADATLKRLGLRKSAAAGAGPV